MTRFKILEFKKSQYSYEVIEKALSEKVSEGWKVVSMHTDVSTDIQGIVVVLLQQIIPGEEENISYVELIQKKEGELALKKIQKQIDDLDMLPAGYSLSQYPGAFEAAVALSQTETVRTGNNNIVSGFAALGQNNAQPQTGKFCTNCGSPVREGKFCAKCGNEI